MSFADELKTTVASMPASRLQESAIVSALASCHLVCNVCSISNDDVENVYVARLQTEPPVKWVCVLDLSSVIIVVSHRTD